jgi:hypothetical protein
MIKLQLHPEPRILRQFAWVSLVAFPVIATLFHFQFGLPTTIALVIGALGPLTLLADLARAHQVSRSVFRALVLLTFPIGLVLFPLLIGVIYYGVFTPMGLFFRLIGRDALHRRPDPKRPSYWHDRGAPRPAASYFKLY